MDHRDLTDAEFVALRELAAGDQAGQAPRPRQSSPELETLCDLGYVDPITGGGFFLSDRGKALIEDKGR